MTGRPPIHDKQKVFDELIAYIDSVPDPMMQEFCSMVAGRPSRDTMNEWCNDASLQEKLPFADTVKRMLSKQESFLVRAQGVNPIMAIFRLKQPCFGYTDKQQIDHQIATRVIDIQLLEAGDE
jgi:hypothetical protein